MVRTLGDESCALTFRVLRMAGASGEKLERAAQVLKDLRALKALMEKGDC